MTVSRVSDLAQSQLLINELNRANQSLNTTQLQISSGKKAQTFSDVADQAGVLLSAKRVLDSNDGYTQTATELGAKLGQQDLALGNLSDASDGLRQDVMQALANDSGLSFMDSVNAAFQTAQSTLNTQVNGEYIFGGTRTNVPPVNVGDMTALGTAPAITGTGGIFENNNVKPSATINDGVTVQYGVTASDVGAGLMTALQKIQQYATANPGAFSSPLSTQDQQFLSGLLDGTNADLPGITNNITAYQAQNGVVQNQVTAVQTQLSNSKVATTQFVSDIEDADLPTALTQLQADQVSVEASARMAAQLGQLSLLNFLPAVT